MLKETTGAFDRTRTHDWQVSTDHESYALPTAPRLILFAFCWQQTVKSRVILKGNCEEINTRYPLSMSVIQSQSLYLTEQMNIDLLQAMALWVFLRMISALIIFLDKIGEQIPTSRNGLCYIYYHNSWLHVSVMSL